jgi:hypothetical protein
MSTQTYPRTVLPDPPPLLPPPAPPPNPRSRWAPAAAFGLILAMVAATIAGSLLFTRLIGAAVAITVRQDPSTVRLPVLPAAPRRPTAADVAAMRSLLTATPSTPGVAIDETLAHQIATAVWPVREQAIDTADVASLSTFESGAALEGDTSLYGTRHCGCTIPPARAMEGLYVFVPKQATFPADFLAEVTMPSVGVGGNAGVELLVFSRTSALTQWSVTLATGYENNSIGPPLVYVTPVPSAGFNAALPATHIDLDALPADLAAYYEHWATAGTAPADPQFAPGYFTSYKGGDVSVHGETNGVGGMHHTVYSADPATDGEWSFAGESFEQAPQDGWILSCGTVRYEDVSTAAVNGALLNQPPDASTWGPTLPPGRYSQITQWGLHESCFVISPTGAPTLVLGIDGGPTRSTGVFVSVES